MFNITSNFIFNQGRPNVDFVRSMKNATSQTEAIWPNSVFNVISYLDFLKIFSPGLYGFMRHNLVKLLIVIPPTFPNHKRAWGNVILLLLHCLQYSFIWFWNSLETMLKFIHTQVKTILIRSDRTQKPHQQRGITGLEAVCKWCSFSCSLGDKPSASAVLFNLEISLK